MTKKIAKKRSGKAKTGPKILKLPGTTVSEASKARLAFHPAVIGATTAQVYIKGTLGELDVTECVGALLQQVEKVHDGDMKQAEAMLITQAHVLNAIFHNLAQRAALNMAGGYVGACETYMRLALKAQSQSRATIEALAFIKNPQPTAFIRQQNVGVNQQVNNGAAPAVTASRAREEISKPANELLEVKHGERLDNGTAGAAIGAHPQLETVGEIHRATDGGGHGTVKPERP